MNFDVATLLLTLKLKIMGTFLGIVLLLIGIILFIGNVSGWWPTFPFAGFITMSIGAGIMRLANDD
ncbi:MAG: hypothetical protein ACTHLB_07560 [Parafilimonas sp.]